MRSMDCKCRPTPPNHCLQAGPTAAWTEPLIQQLTTFPNAAHDDMADMMSQASIWLQSRGSGIVAFWAAEAGRERRSSFFRASPAVARTARSG